jgi:glycine betaine/proline transport system permease protein
MAVASERARIVSRSSQHDWWRNRFVRVAAIVGTVVVAFFPLRRDYRWPDSLAWNSLPGYLDRFQIWLLDQRGAAHQNLILRVFDGFRTFVDHLVTWLNDLLLGLTWVGLAAAGVLIVLRFGGIRAALVVLAAFVSLAGMGLWEESVQTLALMLAAVSLSLLVGMPIGVAVGRSDRVQRAVTPVLDAMQIVPAFAYLMPIVILFSVGPGAAVVTTMIYAVPPAVRITALGIRGVPPNTVEAAEALGSTRWQVLTKVQLPLARRLLLLSVNQTILFALSMVVIAGLIGGRGLGDVVTSGLYSNPALALLGGIAIVVMAIALDRATAAIADRTDPSRRHLTDAVRRRLRLATAATAAGIGLAFVLGKVFGASGVYPKEIGENFRSVSAQPWLLARIQSVLDYVQDPGSAVFHVTEPTGNFLVLHLLQPLQTFLVETPWFLTVAGAVLVAWVLSGLRPAIVAFVMLFTIGVLGKWEPAMDTASQVLVATLIAVALGIALGVWAAESELVARILRPILDVLQTLPQLVYVIPFIYLMPVSYVPGLIASVLYAVPVVIRLVAAGLRDVAPNTVEAARAYGATRSQVLLKVKMPLASDAIMLGVNQGIIMVLAVVVIGGLVGSGALGYEVAEGLQRNAFGQGVVASLAILALGIALDRVTQGNRRSRLEGTR